MRNFLSKEEKDNLKVQHKQERDKRICDRIKAVLLHDEGWNYQDIAHVLLLSDEGIRKHIQDYLSCKKLNTENGGSTSKLNDHQTEELLNHLCKHTYLYAKDIVIYIKKAFNVSFSIPGLTCWLKSHDFSYKKPAIVPGKANPEIQEIWIRNYEELKRNLPEDESICFLDGVHPTHNTKSSYGLNPIERLWKFMNENVLNNRYYEKFKEFRNAVIGFLRGLQNPEPELLQALQKRVNDNFQLLNSQ